MDGAMVLVIAMIILNIVGIVWLGIVLEHPFLLALGYIIALIIVGKINGNACIVVTLVVATITIVAAIVKTIRAGRKAGLQDDLLEAVKMQDKETIQKLIAKGANVNYGMPLVAAIENGNKDMVLLLTQKGASVNSSYGKPLVAAVKNGDKEMVSLLIDKGAKVNVMHEEKLPLDFAEDNEIIALLKSHGAITKKEQDTVDIDFVSAVRNHDIEKVRSLIPQVSDIDIIIPGHELVAEFRTPNGLEREVITPLMYVANFNDIEMMKLLAENGANVNAQDSHGQNAVMYAVFRHDTRMIDFLASKRANMNAGAFNDLASGITALMVAASGGNIETVKALIRNGANVKAQNSKGNTALSVARYNGHTEIANLLKKNGARY